MLAEDQEDKDNSYQKFFSLYNGVILNKRIPKAIGKRCLESMGWLITIRKDESETNLLHPFSGVEIELPHPNTTKDYEDHDGVDWCGRVLVYDVTGSSPTHTQIVAILPPQHKGDEFYIVDLAAGELRETKQVGDRALFLGANASISVHASQFPGVKHNHIYYTDDFVEA
ncbi:hypothetical protein KY284_033028 [Solanum tuberosum]|nr:hypothetical protein KY284_033028 [Solanum tuberosum]